MTPEKKMEEYNITTNYHAAAIAVAKVYYLYVDTWSFVLSPVAMHTHTHSFSTVRLDVFWGDVIGGSAKAERSK